MNVLNYCPHITCGESGVLLDFLSLFVWSYQRWRHQYEHLQHGIFFPVYVLGRGKYLDVVACKEQLEWINANEYQEKFAIQDIICLYANIIYQRMIDRSGELLYRVELDFCSMFYQGFTFQYCFIKALDIYTLWYTKLLNLYIIVNTSNRWILQKTLLPKLYNWRLNFLCFTSEHSVSMWVIKSVAYLVAPYKFMWILSFFRR